MTVLLPSRPVLWLLDRDEDLLRFLSDLVQNANEFEVVKPFNEPGIACRCLADAGPEGDLPWFFVSDKIGFDEVVGGRSVAQLIRERSPVSMVLLHSHSAYEVPGLITNLTRERLIDKDVSKNISGDEFLAIIAKWYRRWNSPIPTKMRDYIASCPDPDTPYFPDDEGNYLTVIDLYREMILESEIGIEAEKVWASILDDSPARA